MALERKSWCTEGTFGGTVYWGASTALHTGCQVCLLWTVSSDFTDLYTFLHFVLQEKFIIYRKYKHTINLKKQVSVGKISENCHVNPGLLNEQNWQLLSIPRFLFDNEILPFDLFVTYDPLSKRFWSHSLIYWTQIHYRLFSFYWKLLGHQNCSVLLSLLLLFPHVNIENLSTIFSWLTPSHKD